jgi:hypothetical protein
MFVAADNSMALGSYRETNPRGACQSVSMVDEDIFERINGLVEEEHRLRDGEGTDPERLRRLEEQLDQCWDLLRQRRAKREFDQPASDAQVRSADTVEHYRG